MQIRLLEIAQIELDDSIEYYNSESDGLGNELLVEVLHALDRIKNFPKACPHFFYPRRKIYLKLLRILSKISQSFEIIINRGNGP
jgi:hypothetical protein